MPNLAAFTKILLAVMISISAFLTDHFLVLLLLAGLEYAAVLFLPGRLLMLRALLVMAVFAAALFGVQLLCGTSYPVACASAMRMAIMANSMVVLLFSTKSQQLTAALVRQCHLSYDYAFMVTAIFRFVPDLLAESRSVREAQACRGFQSKGSPFHRLKGYTAIIKPMVFRAISRSENMAVSLEMRGFMESGQRTFMAETHLRAVDYLTLAGFILLTAGLLRLL